MALPDLNLTPPEGGNIPEEENDEGIIIHEVGTVCIHPKKET
jgi:hypothetical protein